MPDNKMSIEVRDRTIEIVRAFDAPRELVFRAYSDAEAIKQWFGPAPWPVTYCEMDFRVGGTWHFCMTGPDGQQGWSIAHYEEIVPPERIVYRDAFSDADGNVVPPQARITVRFEERGPNRTLLRSESVYASNDERDWVISMGVEEGIGLTYDQLERYLASQGVTS